MYKVMQMKKGVALRGLIAVLLAAVMLLAAMPAVYAQDEISIFIDGVQLAFAEDDGSYAVPILRDGTTYLPVRFISGVLGRPISWDGGTNTVYIGTESVKAQYSNQVKIYLNGQPFSPKDANGNSVQPFIQNGRTYLPVRAVGEAFGLKVGWDGERRRVDLYTPGVYRFVLDGDWSGISESYMEKVMEQIELYPKLMARWGIMGDEPRTIVIHMKDELGPGEVAYTVRDNIYVSKEYVLARPDDYFFFIHELTHSVQNGFDFESDWWIENQADYVRFIFYPFTPDERKGAKDYFKNSATARDWGWEPYGDCEWFFAYLDSRYPTRRSAEGVVTLGLIDSINSAIKHGLVSSDGGTTHSDAGFNAVVKSVTGYDDMEQLRRQFAKELDSGTWSFDGFEAYEGNFLFEEVYDDVQIVWADENLMKGAAVLESNREDGAYLLTDGDFDALWSIGRLNEEEHPYVIFDLGEAKTFNGFSLFANPESRAIDKMQADGVGRGFGRGADGWILQASNDLKSWYDLSENKGLRGASASYDVPQVTMRYIRLEFTDPLEYKNVRYEIGSFAELMLFQRP